jgi:hypothetical protein
MGIDASGWYRQPARPRDDWILGLDVGQSIDPSAVCVLNHQIVPGEWIPDHRNKIAKQAKTERFFVRHLERLPLGMSYPAQIQHVANLMGREPLSFGATFALDYTGCGRPVADQFARAGLRPQKILITGGNEVTRHNGDTFHVPKSYLVSGLESRMHSGELRIADALTESPALKEELRDFGRKVSESGRVTYNARAGAHDDLILAMCIAIFIATNRIESSSEELRI